MKRLALLAITAFMAVVLSACGDNAEKKVENGATSTQQSQDSLGDAAKGSVENPSSQPASPSGHQ